MFAQFQKLFLPILLIVGKIVSNPTQSNVSTSYILPSIFDQFPPYIHFPPLTSKCQNIPEIIRNHLFWPREIYETRILIMKTIKCAGIKLFRKVEENPEKVDYLGLYKGLFTLQNNSKLLQPYTKLRKLQLPNLLDDKSKQARLHKNLEQRLGIKFPWLIPSFNLPKEKLKFYWAWKRNPNQYWIAKPALGFGSRGVQIVSKWTEVPDSNTKERFIVQKYIQNPFLFEGKKVELRSVYLITGYNPLRIFHLHQLSFLKHQFTNYSTDPDSFKNPCVHIRSRIDSECNDNKDVEADRRIIAKIFESIQEAGGNVGYIYDQIQSIAITTLLEWENHVLGKGYRNRFGNFFIISFDFFIDSNFKLWLNEIGNMPGFDPIIQFYANFPEIFNIVGINFPPTLSSEAIEKLRTDFYQVKTPSSTTGYKNPLIYYDYHSCRYKNDWQNQNITTASLDTLTSCEIKLLAILEDELSRTKSSFATRIWPSTNMEQYFPIIHPNHLHKYQLLLRWEKEFKDRRAAGRNILNDLLLINQFMRYKPNICICEKN